MTQSVINDALSFLFLFLVLATSLAGALKREGWLIFVGVLAALWAAAWVLNWADISGLRVVQGLAFYVLLLCLFVMWSGVIERYRIRETERAERLQWRGLQNV